MLWGMHWIDWTIVVLLFVGLSISALACRKYMKSVAGFLVAGRGVGRYLGLSSASMAGLGGVSILSMWQVYYNSGFAGLWWFIPVYLAAFVVAMTGFGIFRFRQSKVMTLPQLLEMRYSRRFRIFCGIITYIAGMLNMSIFPAVASGFFVYFCDLPLQTSILGLTFSTTLLVMIIIVGISVIFAMLGGQLTVIVTDYAQSVCVSFILVAISVIIFKTFSWETFFQAYQSAENGTALLHPYKGNADTDFNVWFFMISVFMSFYLIVAWAPNTMQASSAKDNHEARIMKTMVCFREMGMLLGVILVPLAAFVVMHHSDYATQAQTVTDSLAHITNPQIQNQMLVPVATRQFLPVGLVGALVAVVFFASISTHDTYLLAWSGVLVQDVIIPISGRKISPRTHITLLRLSLVLGGIFIVAFSALFKQNDYIAMFQAISGAIYWAGGAFVVLAALYWKRGTTAGAWASMLTGSGLCMGYFLARACGMQALNGTIVAFFASLTSIVVFVVVSLLTPDPDFDLDEMLNRKDAPPSKGKWYRFSELFGTFDKILFIGLITFVVIMAVAMIAVSVYNWLYDVPVESWMKWWKFYITGMFIFGTCVIMWFTLGGARDLLRLFWALKHEKVNVNDNGSVQGRHAAH